MNNNNKLVIEFKDKTKASVQAYNAAEEALIKLYSEYERNRSELEKKTERIITDHESDVNTLICSHTRPYSLNINGIEENMGWFQGP